MGILNRDFTVVGIASTIGIRVRRRLTSYHDGQLALSTFQSHVTVGLYQRVHIFSHHYAQATAIAGSFQYVIRGSDAIHITEALLNGYHLYTADDEMATCAEALGVVIPPLP